MNKFLRNGLIYLVLIVGYLLLYVVDIEQILYPEQKESKSKVDFVYQQF